ncbi:MAG: AraC family transcriptional regulator [Oscillospiraceae bacterium]
MAEKKDIVELRYYAVDQEFPIMALLGKKWTSHYIRGIHLHFHNLIEIGYCYEGVGNMIFENNTEVPYQSGGFTFIPRNVLHGTQSAIGTVSKWEFIFIDEVILLENLFLAKYDGSQLLKKLTGVEPFVGNEEDYPELGRIIRQIIDEFRHSQSFFREQVNALCIFTLIELARIDRPKKPVELSKNQSAILNVLEYIEKNYEEDLKISDLAKLCNMSEPYFRKLFRELVNLSPLDHLNFVRIQKACAMLTGSDEPIISVALACGYTSVSTFNRNFVRYQSTTPTEYRQNNKNRLKSLNSYIIEKYAGW